MLDAPESPHSTLSSSPPQFWTPSTIAILDAFLDTRAEEERRYNELVRAAACVAGLEGDRTEAMISVEDYLLAFGEDWQLGQFWYKPSFANSLARVIRSLCPPIDPTFYPVDKPFIIAFICSPTAFVAFCHLYSDFSRSNSIRSRLLEYDQRFAVLARGQYVFYDFNEPGQVPQTQTLIHSVHLAIVDPPYLNESTNSKLSHTLSLILHPTKGNFLLIISTSIEHTLRRVYAEPPLGPLYLTQL